MRCERAGYERYLEDLKEVDLGISSRQVGIVAGLLEVDIGRDATDMEREISRVWQRSRGKRYLDIGIASVAAALGLPVWSMMAFRRSIRRRGSSKVPGRCCESCWTIRTGDC